MSAAAPRYARPFVVLFLALLVTCALVPLNPWPFSSWELFSRLRRPVESSWAVVATGRAGQGVTYSVVGGTRCPSLLESARRRYRATTSVRVYHVERLLSDRIGHDAAPPRRTLAFTCTTKGVRATD